MNRFVRVMASSSFLLAAGLSGFIACSDDEPAPLDVGEGGIADVMSNAPIVFGASAPLTGSQAAIGPSTQNVYRVVENQLNAIGGILNRPVVIRVLDDATDTQAADKITTELLAQGVLGFIGPSTSGGALKIHQKFFDAKTLVISPLAISPDLTNAQPAKDRYLFRTESSASLQARALALFAAKGTAPGTTSNVTCSKLAIVHGDDPYGNPVSKAVTDEFEAAGGKVTLNIAVPSATQASYASQIAAVVDSGAECQALLMFAAPGAQYVKDLKTYQTDHPGRDWKRFLTIGTIPFYTPGFITGGRINAADPNAPSAAEGVYGVAIDTTPDTTEFAEYKNLYNAQFVSQDSALSVGPASVYDATILLALAIQQAGTTEDRVKIRDALYAVSKVGRAFGPAHVADAIAAIKNGEDVDWSGASGPCDFDDYGDVLDDHLVWKVENGAFVVVRKIKVSELTTTTQLPDAGTEKDAEVTTDAAADAQPDASVQDASSDAADAADATSSDASFDADADPTDAATDADATGG